MFGMFSSCIVNPVCQACEARDWHTINSEYPVYSCPECGLVYDYSGVLITTCRESLSKTWRIVFPSIDHYLAYQLYLAAPAYWECHPFFTNESMDPAYPSEWLKHLVWAHRGLSTHKVSCLNEVPV